MDKIHENLKKFAKFKENFEKEKEQSVKAIALIRAYRIRGHLIANLDPLEMMERKYLHELHPADHGFKKEDYNKCDLWKPIRNATEKDRWGMTLYSDYTIADVKKYNRKGSLWIQGKCGDKLKDTYIGSKEVAVKLAKEILEYYKQG